MNQQLMVIISHMQFGATEFQSQDIIERLFESGVWLFALTTAKVATLEPGDFVLVYAAGKGNRYFVGNFTIASKPEQWTSPKTGLEDLMKYFSIGCFIEDAELWATRVPMSEVVHDLDFIQDKKNYGLYLRQGAKILTQQDVDVVLAARDRLAT